MSVKTEEQVLSLLCKKDDGSRVGKAYRASLFQEHPSTAIPIVVNYADHLSLGVAIGTISSTYKVEKKDDAYTFVAHGRTFVLRYHPIVNVVDFDLVECDSIAMSFTREGEDLSQTQGEEFEKKRCRLLPVMDETNWKERQYALLSYLKSGWTLLDEEDRAILFLIPLEDNSSVFVFKNQQQLDPDVQWLKSTVVEAKAAPTPKAESNTKLAEFKVELKALLAKCDMI